MNKSQIKRQREMQRSRTTDKLFLAFILGAHLLVFTAPAVVASSLSSDKFADAIQSAHIIDGKEANDNADRAISYQPLNHDSREIIAAASLVIELILDPSDLRDLKADNIVLTSTFSERSCGALDESRSFAWKIDKRLNVSRIHLIIDEEKKSLGGSTLFLCVLDTITGRFRHLGDTARLPIER